MSWPAACVQDQVDAAVKELLSLKAEFKQITGQDYKPGMAPPTAAPAPAPAPASVSTSGASPAALYGSVSEQGELVRKLKTEKAPKVN